VFGAAGYTFVLVNSSSEQEEKSCQLRSCGGGHDSWFRVQALSVDDKQQTILDGKENKDGRYGNSLSYLDERLVRSKWNHNWDGRADYRQQDQTATITNSYGIQDGRQSSNQNSQRSVISERDAIGNSVNGGGNNDVTTGSSSISKQRRQTPSALPTASRHLFLIRHGQYNMAGNEDSQHTLTAKGREQAAMTGRRLREMSLPYSSLTHSTMVRAIETAQIITSELFDQPIPIRSCPLLREGAPIRPEPVLTNWKTDKYYQDGDRIEAAFRKYFHRADPNQNGDSYEIIVCHANVIRYFVCRALQIPADAWLRLSLHHASLTWLSIRPSGRVTLRTFGDSGHMPKEHLTIS